MLGRFKVRPTKFLKRKGFMKYNIINITIMSANANAIETQAAPSGPFEMVPASQSDGAGITTFADDTSGFISTAVDQRSSFRALSTVDIPGARDIKDFLVRPTIITQGTFGTSDSGTLWSGDVFSTLVTGSKASKLTGIYGIRADLRLVLQVNAVRFQSGRYILGWVASGGVPTTNAGFTAAFKSHNAHLVNSTQCPHVEIDIATQTHVEMVIPWDTIYPFFVNLSTYPVGVGMAFIRPYSPLSAASGDTTCGYTLWASFENISLVGATVTQSSYGEKEQRSAGIGPISGPLTSVSKVGSILGELPIVGPYAKTVGWTADILARAAKVFGWSKPNHLATSGAVQNRPYRYAANADGEAYPTVLGVSSDNRLVSAPRVGGTTIDEMSFDFLKSIFCYNTQATWTSANTVGAVLLSISVRPDSGDAALGSGWVMSPSSFITKHFTHWRGSMKFRIKLVKNEFYSGRVAVWFEPNWHSTNVSASFALSEYNHRMILDIRETSEAEFVCPYISNEVYTPVGNGIGTFVVAIVDPLVCPNSVPSSIVILVEACSGPDMEWMGYSPIDYEPWVPVTTQSAYRSEKTYSLGSVDKVDPTFASSVAAGEKPESLRQLIKIFTPDVLANGTITVTMTQNNMIKIQPYYHQVVTQATSNTTPLNRGRFIANELDCVSSLYACETGSVRVFALQPNNGDWLNWLFASRTTSTSGDILQSLIPNVSELKDIRAPLQVSRGDPAEIQSPPYQIGIGRAVCQNWTSTGAPALNPSGANRNGVGIYTLGTSVDSHVIFSRVASDDYNCWNFISVPAMVTNTQT